MVVETFRADSMPETAGGRAAMTRPAPSAPAATTPITLVRIALDNLFTSSPSVAGRIGPIRRATLRNPAALLRNLTALGQCRAAAAAGPSSPVSRCTPFAGPHGRPRCYSQEIRPGIDGCVGHRRTACQQLLEQWPAEKRRGSKRPTTSTRWDRWLVSIAAGAKSRRRKKCRFPNLQRGPR